MPTIEVNGAPKSYDSAEDTPLLWILRDDLQMTGTKYSCGMGLCGSCTVLVDGNPTRSCITPVSLVKEKKITTIEGLGQDQLTPVQLAWKQISVPQCGYCQSGQIMAATALLKENPNPSREDIRTYMAGNLCRCGTYPRIEKAIQIAASMQKEHTHDKAKN